MVWVGCLWMIAGIEKLVFETASKSWLDKIGCGGEAERWGQELRSILLSNHSENTRYK